jgi:hypothetical protein
MQAAGQLGTQDLGVANLGMGIGQLGLSQEGQRQQNLQTSAGASSQEAFNALNLASQLRGPENAFQQQATMEGMNNLGVSNGISAIASQYARPLFQAPQAGAVPASLQGLTADILAAGGSSGQLTPTQQAYNAALANKGAPTWTSLAQGMLGNLSQDRSTAYGQYGNVQNALSDSSKSLVPVWDAAKGQYTFAYPNDGSGQGTFDAAGQAAAKPNSYTPPSAQSNQFLGGNYNGGGSGSASTSPGYGPQVNYKPASGSGANGGGSDLGSNGYVPGGSYMTANQPSGPGFYAPGGQGYTNSLSALPNPNQINLRNWYRLPTDTQSFIDSAYNAKGYSTNDINGTIKNLALPYQAPMSGAIR